MQIHDLLPDADVLINLSVEELAYSLLKLASENLQNGMIYRDRLISIEPQPGQSKHYVDADDSLIVLALTEALHWLEVNAFLLPASGDNGKNGYRIMGRRGKELIDRERFDAFRRAAEFPKGLLHPNIADRVWIALARDELSDAVFIAFRAVEESVRDAGNYSNVDIGVDLMRRAFHADSGPLTDTSQPRAEREALAHLFAGAIGSYKNPHSHRDVTIQDRLEAQEMVMLASHLLRIIDARGSRGE